MEIDRRRNGFPKQPVVICAAMSSRSRDPLAEAAHCRRSADRRPQLGRDPPRQRRAHAALHLGVRRRIELLVFEQADVRPGDTARRPGGRRERLEPCTDLGARAVSAARSSATPRPCSAASPACRRQWTAVPSATPGKAQMPAISLSAKRARSTAAPRPRLGSHSFSSSGERL